ncbi:MAG TPA: LysR family transcriptional regulator [Tepidisphaeraceae bacterium]|nr:LysR family transcriptional regulator [Tepidisphaeraceae bacterium]
MNLGHLAIFHAIAEEGSVSRGADRLTVSQPAVSKQLRLLERALGTTLMERGPRGITLTESGDLLAGYARQIFALEDEALRAIRQLRGLERGRLAIGASTTIGVYLLPELFVRFRRQYPAIDTTLEVSNARLIQQRLGEGAIDVGFMELQPEGDGWESTTFMSDDLVAIAPPGHPLLSRSRVTSEAFCGEPFVVRATGSDTKSFVEEALAERGLEVKPIMSLGSTEAIKRAVAAGIGVAIVSHLAIEMELKAKALAIVPVKGLSIRRPLLRVRRKNAPEMPALTAFLKLLKRDAS